MKYDKQTGFRTKTETWKKLVKISKQEDRTVSYIINKIIEDNINKFIKK